LALVKSGPELSLQAQMGRFLPTGLSLPTDSPWWFNWFEGEIVIQKSEAPFIDKMICTLCKGWMNAY
jgi:hypothetical protein